MGPARPERRFTLPPARRASWGTWALALVVHALLAALLITEPRGYDPAARSRFLDLAPIALAPAPREVEMRLGRTTPLPVPRAELPARAVVVVPPGASPRLSPVTPRVTPPPTTSLTPTAILTVPVDTPPTRAPKIGAQYAGGRVWLRPLPETPREIAQRLTGKSQAEVVDSAVDAIVQAYLDAMAKDTLAAKRNALPSWTTKIAGQLVGLDAKWIYLGPLKIPTVLLGLLPINLQGNPTQADMNRRLSAMREDLYYAARRSDNLTEFKKAVKTLRDEKQRQKDFERNQRTRPDSATP